MAAVSLKVRVDDLEWLLRSLDQSIASIDKFDVRVRAAEDLLIEYETDAGVLRARAEAAEANQRTPGKTEVCENHVYPSCRNHAGGWRLAPCNIKPCPLKDQP